MSHFIFTEERAEGTTYVWRWEEWADGKLLRQSIPFADWQTCIAEAKKIGYQEPSLAESPG